MCQAETEARPGYQVKQVQQLLRAACDAELRPTGLSLSQYAVLRALADHPGASSAELARRCFVKRQSLGELLRALVAAGLVTVSDATTGRARPTTLTHAGRERLRIAERAVITVEQRMVTGLSDRDRTHLGRLLATCADNLIARPTPRGGAS